VCARAGVSRATFYALWDGREACLLAAVQDSVARITALAVPPHRAGSSWRERVRGALGASLRLFDQEPQLARVCVVESLGGGPRVLEYRAEVVKSLSAAVEEGRVEPDAGSEYTSLIAESVVGAVLGVIYARILAGRQEPLAALESDLMSIIVLPYLGPSAAARELGTPSSEATRPPAQPRPSPRIPTNSPLADATAGLNMRVTHRSLLVLSVISATPGASNREIAQAAGIRDQGQISRLLRRLEHLGLIHDEVDAFGGGRPANGYGLAGGAGARRRRARCAWRITERGERLVLVRVPAGEPADM
jgi:AcrR family transcriptional regulator